MRYHNFTHVHLKPQSYEVQFLRYGVRRFCHFGLFFALLPPSPPPNSPKNENIKKMKKTPGDIIILHNCTKTHDYRLYCS